MTALSAFPNFPALNDFDPYGDVRKKRDDLFAGPAQPAPPTAAEEGMLPRVMGAASWLGSTLDKPGSAVRGLLGGDPSQLANLIPFSDTMGLTNAPAGTKSVFGTEPITHEGSKIYGSDLLTKMGLPEAPEEWSWENAPAKIGRGALGLGLDIASDPLTYVTGPLGMMARGEKEAQAAMRAIDTSHFGQVATALQAGMKDAGPGGLPSVVGPLGDVFRYGPAQYAQDIRSGAQKAFGIGLPWSREPALSFNLISPEFSANVIEKGLMGAYSPVNWLRGIFSPSVAKDRMTFEPLEQVRNDGLDVAKRYYGAAAKTMTASLRQFEGDLNASWEQIGAHLKDNGDYRSLEDLQRYMSEHASRFPTAADFEQHIAGALDAPVADPAKLAAIAQKMHETYGGIHDANAYLLKLNQEWGNPTKELEDAYVRTADYMARYSEAGRAAAAKVRKNLFDQGLGVNSNAARQEFLRDVPEGTLTVNAVARDELNHGKQLVDGDLEDFEKPKDWDDALREKLRDAATAQPGPNAAASSPGLWFDPATIDKMDHEELLTAYNNEYHIRPAHERSWPAGGPQSITLPPFESEGQPRVLTAESEKARWQAGDDTRGLVGTAQALAKSYGDDVIHNGIFDHSVISDAVTRNQHALENLANVMSAHAFAEHPGVVGRAGEAGFNAAYKPFADAWREAGYTKEGLAKFIDRKYGGEMAEGINKELGLAADAADPLKQQAMQVLANAKVINDPGLSMSDALAMVESETRQKAADEIGRGLLIHPDAEGAMKAYRGAMRPENQNAILEGLGKLKGIYQKTLYNIFPTSFVRDFVSHTFNQWSQGEVANPLKLMGGYRDVAAALKDGSGPAAEHLREAENLGLLRHGDLMDATQSVSRPAGGFIDNFRNGPLPGVRPGAETGNSSGLGRAAEWLAEKSQIPAWDRGMTRARNWQNAVQRGGYYHVLREAGASPAAAAEKVLGASFDYGDQSKFSRSVMNRAFLFWGYRSKNMPYQLANLIAKPGGQTAQTLRALTQLGGNNQPGVYTPEFLRERQNIPIGQNPENQGFFSTTAIPFNDLNDVVLGGGALHNIGRTAEKLAAGTAPYLLWPGELATGRQFSTGRSLADLERSPTPNPVINTALHYSPLSRLAGDYSTGTAALGLAEGKEKTGLQSALNYLSPGGTVANYNTVKWKLNDIRDEYQRRMLAEGQKSYQDFYLPKDTAKGMTPAAVEDAEKKRQRLAQIGKLSQALNKKAAAQKAATAAEGGA